jgi:hypothetical protein
LDLQSVAIFAAMQMEASAIRRALPKLQVWMLGISAKRLPLESEVSRRSVVILAGLSGALDPTLRIGDIVVDDPTGLLPASIQYRRGAIASADEIIGTPAEKARLFQRTKALAVDMEGAVIREFTERLKIPFLHVRAISDTADETLDSRVLGFVDDVGRVRPLQMAAAIARRPNLIPYLNRLGKNSKLALDRLGRAVAEIIAAINLPSRSNHR